MNTYPNIAFITTEVRSLKIYYDPEYDRVVDESVPRKQYEWFKQQNWFHKTYEQFLADNFLNEDMTKIQ